MFNILTDYLRCVSLRLWFIRELYYHFVRNARYIINIDVILFHSSYNKPNHHWSFVIILQSVWHNAYCKYNHYDQYIFLLIVYHITYLCYCYYIGMYGWNWFAILQPSAAVDNNIFYWIFLYVLFYGSIRTNQIILLLLLLLRYTQDCTMCAIVVHMLLWVLW